MDRFSAILKAPLPFAVFRLTSQARKPALRPFRLGSAHAQQIPVMTTTPPSHKEPTTVMANYVLTEENCWFDSVTYAYEVSGEPLQQLQRIRIRHLPVNHNLHSHNKLLMPRAHVTARSSLRQPWVNQCRPFHRQHDPPPPLHVSIPVSTYDTLRQVWDGLRGDCKLLKPPLWY